MVHLCEPPYRLYRQYPVPLRPSPQVCSPCHTSLPGPKLCPECRGPYDNPVRHNLLAQRIISRTQSPVSCGNLTCKEMIQGVRMAEHMAECRHRMVPCPFSSCYSKILISDVSEHIKVHHHAISRRMINMKDDFTIENDSDDSDADWDPTVYKVQGQRFYLQCLLRKKIFMAWVMVEGGREEASKWRATIAVTRPKKNSICESDVFPIDMTTEVVNI